MTCQVFVVSGQSYDALWFTTELREDVTLLRVACADPVFVTGIKQILRGDLGPKETYPCVTAALHGRGILRAAGYSNELHGLRD